GRAWAAMREDEVAAASMGINLVTTKLFAFSLGASFSGFAGTIWASYLQVIAPEQFRFDVSIFVLVMIILGGLGNIGGVIAGGLVAVSAIDFTIPEGTIVSLIGPNGAGKTTFFNVVAGLYKPTRGRVMFDGHDISGQPPHRITRLGIARTFQNIRLFQNMTALENVMVGHHARR